MCASCLAARRCAAVIFFRDIPLFVVQPLRTARNHSGGRAESAALGSGQVALQRSTSPEKGEDQLEQGSAALAERMVPSLKLNAFKITGNFEGGLNGA